MVHRLLGLKRLQNVATVSRTRGSLDKSAEWESRTLSRSLALVLHSEPRRVFRRAPGLGQAAMARPDC